MSLEVVRLFYCVRALTRRSIGSENMNNAKTHNPSVKPQQKENHANFTAWALGLITFVVFCNTATAINPPVKANAASQARLVETYGKLPLSFEINQGQTDKTVKFISRDQCYTLFFTPTEAVLALRKAGPKPGSKQGPEEVAHTK